MALEVKARTVRLNLKPNLKPTKHHIRKVVCGLLFAGYFPTNTRQPSYLIADLKTNTSSARSCVQPVVVIMAPKRAMDSNMAPRVVRTEEVMLNEISVEEDSGWRPICEVMVTTLMGTFRSGDYGSGILTIPSLLMIDNKAAISTRDGRTRINNGKSTIVALKRLEEEYNEEHPSAPTVSPPSTSAEACPHDLETHWPANLVNIFSHGVRVDWVELAQDDADLHFAWNAMIHDADVNKYRVTTISQKIDVAKRYNSRVPGGDWDATRKLLMTVLGSGKRVNIWRWITAARTLSEDVLHILDLRPDLAHSVVFENKYFCGQGEERKYKLSKIFAERALLLMYDKLDSGCLVSSKDFQSDFCSPMKTVEVWQRSLLGHFGTNVESLPAVKRVIEMLTHEGGRMKVLGCMKQKVPLHGRNGQDGIPECTMIWNELTSCKSGAAQTDKTTDTIVDATASEDGSQEACPHDMSVDDANMVCGDGDAISEPDPVEAKARELAFGDLSHITIENDVARLQQALRTRVMPSSRVLYMVDAPTSRIRCVLDLIQSVETISKEFKNTEFQLLVTCGHRLDLLAAVHSNLSTRWAQKQAYVVQVPNSTVQAQRNLPSYVVYMPGDTVRGKTWPTALVMTNVKASSHECLRLICRDAKCLFRGTDPSSLDDTDVDDREPDLMQDLLEEEEEETDATGAPFTLGGMSPGFAGTKLFTFSRPVAYYVSMIRGLTGALGMNIFVPLIRTAHPGLLVAGRSIGMEVLCGQFGVKPHAHEHGKQVMENILTKRKWKDAQKLVSPVLAKRLRASSLTFITVEAESPQIVRVKDIEPPLESGWRAGMNRTVEDLPTKSQELVVAELARFPVEVGPQQYGRGIFAARALKENEVVCSCSALWFDSATGLQDMLNVPGNIIFADRLIRVDNMDLTTNTSPEPIVGSLYGALVGIAGYLNHWGNIRRGGPNLVLRVTPGKGFGDTLVEAVVRTRNGVGIAVKQSLVLNYGLEYDFAAANTVDDSDHAVKKFRGSLDKFFGSSDMPPPNVVPQKTPPKAAAPNVAAEAKASGVPPPEGKSPAGSPNTVPAIKGTAETPPGNTKNTPAKPPAAVEKSVPPTALPKASSASTEPPSGSSGDQLLGTCVGTDIGPEKLELWLDGECLRLKSNVDRNLKIAPNTILAIIRQGDLKSHGDENGVDWALLHPKKEKVFLFQSNKPKLDVTGPKTLWAVIEETKATKMSFHGEWTTGKVPCAFAPKAKASFLPTMPDQLKLSLLIRKMSQVALVWILKLETDKLCPWAVAVVNPKQICVPAKCAHQLH